MSSAVGCHNIRMFTREKISRFSSTWTRIPISAASTAARRPTGPAPEMTTRVPSFDIGRSFQFSASALISDLVLCGTVDTTVG